MPKTRELQVSNRLHIYERRMEGKCLQQIAHGFGISKEGVRKICQKLQKKKKDKPENSVKSGKRKQLLAKIS